MGGLHEVGLLRKTGGRQQIGGKAMFAYIWPIALVVLANTIYQVAAKSIPSDMNPLASLTIVYLVGAVSSIAMYYSVNRGANLVTELAKTNWAPFILGIAVVGLEVGFIYAYKAGWPVSTASIVQSSFLAVALIFVGFLAYHEPLTWNKLVGVVICLVGLYFINMK